MGRRFRPAFAAIVGIAVVGLCLHAQRAGSSPPAHRKAVPDHTRPQTAIPQLVDITASTGIHFKHLASPDKKYIVESMSGGVAVIDYDRDGWPDIYFTNAPTVEMAMHGERARSALYRNNHDGT